MMNLFQIAGNVGQVRESTTSNGNTITRVSVATNRSRKVGDEWKEETDWHQITVFGKTAERIAKHVVPGDVFIASGSIRPRRYEKNGETVYVTDLVANEVRWAHRSKPTG